MGISTKKKEDRLQLKGFPPISNGAARLKEHAVGIVLILLLISLGFLFVATRTLSVLRDNSADSCGDCVSTALVATSVISHCLWHRLISRAPGRNSQPNWFTFTPRAYPFAGKYIQGTIPTEIGQLSSLQSLRSYHIQLTGGVPNEFGRLTACTSFHITHNQKIPPTLATRFTIDGIDPPSWEWVGWDFAAQALVPPDVFRLGQGAECRVPMPRLCLAP